MTWDENARDFLEPKKEDSDFLLDPGPEQEDA